MTATPAPVPVPTGPTRDGGFTLVELLIAITLLGIVMASLVGAIFVGLTQTADAGTRLDESHDLRLVASTFAADVAGANAMTTGTAPRCGTDPAASVVVELVGGTFDPAALPSAPPTASPAPVPWPDPVVVTYVRRTVTVDGAAAVELHRLECGAVGRTTPDGDRVVARRLSSSTSPSATCRTAPTTTAAQGAAVACSATTAVTVRLTLTPLSGDGTLTTTLVGHRRTT